MKQVMKNVIIATLVFLVIAGLFSFWTTGTKETSEVDLGQLVTQIEKGEVREILVAGDKLEITLKDDTNEVATKEPTDSLTTALANYQIDAVKMRDVKITVKDGSTASLWFGTILPFVLPFLLIGAFLFFMLRQVQGGNNRAMSFGQSRARETAPTDGKSKVTFKDVAGVKEAKQDLEEIVEFLRSPRKFLALGARIPKGVLLVGAPGTGKTLLAKAVSGEAGVPFFHMSGSEFVEMFVGVGASRVRDLFKRAKRAAPAIVFVDEIDAVGRSRGSGLGGSHDEREQTLNQILVEMDGFETDTNVIVMAATNRPDVLDQALLRPGRFDRRVVLSLPDISEREEILTVHSRKKILEPDVNLRQIAERTPGFSGADLENLLNEAALLAARRNKKSVTMTECLESIERVLLGPERKSHILTPKEKNIAAYHEAGHALVAHEVHPTEKVRKVSIVSRGSAGGFTLKLPSEEKHMYSLSEFISEIAVLMGGYVTEKEIFSEVTTGASSDLQKATKIARQLVTEYGMSDKLGPRTYGEREDMIFLGKEIHENRDYSEQVAATIDEEVSKFLAKGYTVAKTIIRKLRPKLEEIAALLVKQETIEQAEFEALFSSSPAPAPLSEAPAKP